MPWLGTVLVSNTPHTAAAVHISEYFTNYYKVFVYLL